MSSIINPFAEEEKALETKIDSAADDGLKVIINETEREERWKQRRIGKMTSSNFDNLMKVKKNGRMALKSGIDYLIEIVHQRETGVDSEYVSNANFRWGHDHEEEAHLYYKKVTGIPMFSGTNDFKDILFVDDILKGVGDSPDGRTADGKGTAEYKCPINGANHLRNMVLTSFNDTNAYFWQVMGHMLDPKVEWCDFVSFDPRYPDGHPNKIKILRTYRKDVLEPIARLTQRLKYFNDLIEEGEIEEILNL